MPNDPREDEIPLGIWCDFLEKELKTALDDLDKIRKAKSPSEKRDIGIMLMSDSKLNATEFPKLFATEKKSRDIIVLLLE